MASAAQQRSCLLKLAEKGFPAKFLATFGFVQFLPSYFADWGKECSGFTVRMALETFRLFPKYSSWWLYTYGGVRAPGQPEPERVDPALIATDLSESLAPLLDVLPPLGTIIERVAEKRKTIAPTDDRTFIDSVVIPLRNPSEERAARRSLLTFTSKLTNDELPAAGLDLLIYYTREWASPSLDDREVHELLGLGRALRAARAGDEDMMDVDVADPAAGTAGDGHAVVAQPRAARRRLKPQDVAAGVTAGCLPTANLTASEKASLDLLAGNLGGVKVQELAEEGGAGMGQ